MPLSQLQHVDARPQSQGRHGGETGAQPGRGLLVPAGPAQAHAGPHSPALARYGRRELVAAELAQAERHLVPQLPPQAVPPGEIGRAGDSGAGAKHRVKDGEVVELEGGASDPAGAPLSRQRRRLRQPGGSGRVGVASSRGPDRFEAKENIRWTVRLSNSQASDAGSSHQRESGRQVGARSEASVAEGKQS